MKNPFARQFPTLVVSGNCGVSVRTDAMGWYLRGVVTYIQLSIGLDY
jgi:hypothetical protein